jgi:hypothetical protein
MKKTILCLAALAGFSLHAAELNPSQIPDSAKWLLHADFDAMRSSQTGKAVFKQIDAEHGAKLRALKRMFSLHLVNDTRDITLFGNGQPNQAVILLNAKFDKAHVLDVLAAGENYSESEHDGITIHSWTDKKKTQTAAFPENNLLVFSERRELLIEALDQLKAGTTRQADPFFTAAGGRPLVCAMARLGEIDMPADASRVLRMARVLRIAMNENEGRFSIRMNAESESDRQAKLLSRILGGIVAFAEATDPKLENLDFQSDIRETRNPAGVGTTLSLPVPQWLDLMKKAAAEKAAKEAKKKSRKKD